MSDHHNHRAHLLVPTQGVSRMQRGAGHHPGDVGQSVERRQAGTQGLPQDQTLEEEAGFGGGKGSGNNLSCLSHKPIGSRSASEDTAGQTPDSEYDNHETGFHICFPLDVDIGRRISDRATRLTEAERRRRANENEQSEYQRSQRVHPAIMYTRGPIKAFHSKHNPPPLMTKELGYIDARFIKEYFQSPSPPSTAEKLPAFVTHFTNINIPEGVYIEPLYAETPDGMSFDYLWVRFPDDDGLTFTHSCQFSGCVAKGIDGMHFERMIVVDMKAPLLMSEDLPHRAGALAAVKHEDEHEDQCVNARKSLPVEEPWTIKWDGKFQFIGFEDDPESFLPVQHHHQQQQQQRTPAEDMIAEPEIDDAGRVDDSEFDEELEAQVHDFRDWLYDVVYRRRV